MRRFLLIFIIIAIAAALRFYNVNWDQGQHLHPDERFLTMVAAAEKVPTSFFDYLDPSKSTLNPYINNFSFFVYGTFPVTLVKLLVSGTARDNYFDIVLIGRYTSAFLDIITLCFTMLIAHYFTKKYSLSKLLPYIAGVLYGITVIAIQHAHFFTVDSFLTCFVTGVIFFSLKFKEKPSIASAVGVGLMAGLALATKISAIYSAPLAGVFMVYGMLGERKKIRSLFFITATTVITYITLRCADPRLFATANFFDLTINPAFLANIKQLSAFNSPETIFPPSVQWLSKTPILFPLQNIAAFGLGIPYFISALIGFVGLLFLKKKDVLYILIWIFGVFVYLGSQFVTTMRYFYMLYPFFAIMGAFGMLMVYNKAPKQWRSFVLVVMLSVISIWPAAFMAIYTRPHSRVAASYWIYKNIPEGSKIIGEYWDDGLPLGLPDVPPKKYVGLSAPVFDPDTTEKWTALNATIAQSDYWITSSNRGYGSIVPLPGRYPKMSAFYKDLFAGRAGYIKIAEIASFPTLNFGFTKIVFDDQWADEAFTVYDHPKVTIFKRVK